MFPRAGVPGHASLPSLDLKHTEIPQLHPAFPYQRLDEGIERPLDEFPRAKLGKIELFRDRFDDVFLGHAHVTP